MEGHYSNALSDGTNGTKAHCEKYRSHGRSQGVPKIFRAPICRAHCAVIFAIAQLSCDSLVSIVMSGKMKANLGSGQIWYLLATYAI